MSNFGLQPGNVPTWPLVLLFASLALALQLRLMRTRREAARHPPPSRLDD
ncbi:MAG: hypothetical protein KJ587_11045 [Alphaproteobacteria bacterium]|nr:hypothetical protein [Alphaproteobacteria bacterium]